MIPGNARIAGCAVLALILAGSCKGVTNDDENFIVLTSRASVNSGGGQVTGPSDSPDITPDGRYVVFTSRAPDLVSGDTNGRIDVFRKNLVTGETVRVSVEDPGNPDGLNDGDNTNEDSFNPAISADGRFVVFETFSEDLVLGDTNFTTDVFLRDITLGTTTRVSLEHPSDPDADGDPDRNANGSSFSADISDDGRYVAFASDADDLVPADFFAGAGLQDIFIFDREFSVMVRVSTSTTGIAANSHSSSPAISGDGRVIAFLSDADNLVDGFVDGNGTTRDVFVKEWLAVTPTTERVSLPDPTTTETEANAGTFETPSISTDGRFVAFATSADNLVVGDNNSPSGGSDAFVRDRALGTTVRASISFQGTELLNGTFGPALISADGRFVAFGSFSPDAVLNDTNNASDVYVRDTVAGTTVRASVATYGVETSSFFGSFNAAISGDGRFVAFESSAPNLTANDTNGVSDIFVRGPMY